jgi:hypothetical protein
MLMRQGSEQIPAMLTVDALIDRDRAKGASEYDSTRVGQIVTGNHVEVAVAGHDCFIQVGADRQVSTDGQSHDQPWPVPGLRQRGGLRGVGGGVKGRADSTMALQCLGEQDPQVNVQLRRRVPGETAP